MNLSDMTMAARGTPVAGSFVFGREIEMKISEISVNLGSHLACSPGAGDPEKNMGACEFP